MSSHSPNAASTRWCPFARARGPIVDEHTATVVGGVTVNRNETGGPDRDCFCLGPLCMAWRWHDTHTGYCGLAGRPTDPPKE